VAGTPVSGCDRPDNEGQPSERRAMKASALPAQVAARYQEIVGSFDACLDIETTGLSCEYAGITVIGMYLVNGADDRFVQLVGMDVTADNLHESLAGVNKIYTYNGSRFDLPSAGGSWVPANSPEVLLNRRCRGIF